MANWETGKGNFGLKIVDINGDIEKAWFTTSSARDKTYKQMRKEAHVKTIDKIKR